MDINKDDKISYPEFLAAMIKKKKYLCEVRLNSVFKMFDSNNDGKI